MPAIAADRPDPGRRTPRTRSALLAAIVVAFTGVVTQLLRGGALDGPDRAASGLARGQQQGWLHDLMTAVSIMGGTTAAAALLLSMAAVLSVRSQRWAPLRSAVVAMVLLAVVVTAGKGFVGPGAARIVDVGNFQGPSFPCGPVTTAVVAGGVAVLLLRGRIGPMLHRAVCALVPVVAVAVGMSQIYLGRHRLSDVLASGVLGVMLLAVVVVVGHRWRRAAGESGRSWPHRAHR